MKPLSAQNVANVVRKLRKFERPQAGGARWQVVAVDTGGRQVLPELRNATLDVAGARDGKDAAGAAHGVDQRPEVRMDRNIATLARVLGVVVVSSAAFMSRVRRTLMTSSRTADHCSP